MEPFDNWNEPNICIDSKSTGFYLSRNCEGITHGVGSWGFLRGIECYGDKCHLTHLVKPLAVIKNISNVDMKWTCSFELYDLTDQQWQYRILRDSTVLHTSPEYNNNVTVNCDVAPEDAHAMAFTIEDIVPPKTTYTYYMQGKQLTSKIDTAIKLKVITKNTTVVA